MSNCDISSAKKKEKKVALSSLGQGDAFRLPGKSYNEAIGGDDAGGCFYRVLEQKKDGLVEVVSLDFKNRRKLPEETLVHSHYLHMEVHPD